MGVHYRQAVPAAANRERLAAADDALPLSDLIRRYPAWLVGGLLATTYLGLVAFRLDGLMSVWLAATLLASVADPRLGIVLLAVTFIPPEVDIVTGLPTGFFIAAAAALGALIRMVNEARQIRIVWAIGALLGFSLITLVNLLWVMTRRTPAPDAVREWAVVFAGVLVCLVVMSNRRSAERVPVIVFALGASVAVVGALAVVLPGLFHGGPFDWLVRPDDSGRAMGSTHGANILGLVAAMSFAYFTIQAVGGHKPLERGLSAAVALACLPALYFTFSRSAALGVGVAVVVGLLLMRRRIAVLVAAILVAGAVVLAGSLFANRLDTSSGVTGGHLDPRVVDAQSTSDRLRLQAWAAAARMAIARPVTGVGFGRYRDLRVEYGGPAELNTPHSDYLRFFAETGFPGGMAFLLFGAGVAWSLRTARQPDRAGLAAAILTFGIATQFNAQLYYLEVALGFWIAVGASLATAEGADEQRRDLVYDDRTSDIPRWPGTSAP